jgi:5-(carboxyamino)imidazole ribonucleotide synthase
VLHTTQNRLREKTALRDAGLPVTPFAAVRSLEDLHAALESLGAPAVLKTAAWGYDGKGQIVIRDIPQAEYAWNQLHTEEAVLETFIDFECELSVVAARGQDGSFAHYGPMENRHANHILDVTICPANLPAEVNRQAEEIARTVFEQLDVVGVLCVEFFLTRNRQLLINELAPRPHNSGHLTVDAHATCQFEQQVRAVCGLPLGSTEQLRPAVMANLLGDLWQNGEPDWVAALSHPAVKLHLYGKQAARPGRKMGHLTALAERTETALEQALSARSALGNLS